jgi:hypothetical protein
MAIRVAGINCLNMGKESAPLDDNSLSFERD